MRGEGGEIQAFRTSLEERYGLASQREDEPACGGAAVPASCACLPMVVEELAVAAARKPSMASPARGAIRAHALGE